MFARLGQKKSVDGLDKQLFASLPHGVKLRDVIEIYGDVGCGKTNILLHLTANCILPSAWEGVFLGGRGVKLIFVDNDYHFSLLRLVEILEERVRESFMQQNCTIPSGMESFIKSCLSRLIVAKCKSTDEFLTTVETLDEILRQDADICVMMIDSVSAFFFLDRNIAGSGYKAHECYQRKLVQLVRRYIDQYNLVVLATVPAISSKDSRSVTKVEDYSYMGRSWRNLVTYAFVVSREASTFSMKLVKSVPKQADLVVEFSIEKTGLMF